MDEKHRFLQLNATSNGSMKFFSMNIVLLIKKSSKECSNVPTNPITITRIFPHWPIVYLIDRSTPSYRPIGIKIDL